MIACFDTIGSDPRLRILWDDRPFNFSALNNRAVHSAQGELVCLINDDIEVICGEWLTEMVSIALQPGVGAVGARLWYPNNTMQHGGVVLGVNGVAGHSHKQLPKGHSGYFWRAVLQQSFSAVTAACLVVRRSIFLEVGGFEEENLKIAFVAMLIFVLGFARRATATSGRLMRKLITMNRPHAVLRILPRSRQELRVRRDTC